MGVKSIRSDMTCTIRWKITVHNGWCNSHWKANTNANTNVNKNTNENENTNEKIQIKTKLQIISMCLIYVDKYIICFDQDKTSTWVDQKWRERVHV